jgi:cinnamyl-alcohol dehydrogenase
LLAIQAAMGTMDGVIDTVSAMHPILPLISLLKTQGKLVLVGAPAKPLELPVFPLIVGMYKCMYLSTLPENRRKATELQTDIFRR